MPIEKRFALLLGLTLRRPPQNICDRLLDSATGKTGFCRPTCSSIIPLDWLFPHILSSLLDNLSSLNDKSAEKTNFLNEKAMGTEMKTPENSENSLRNRKKKENVVEKCEKSVKNSSKSSEKMEAKSTTEERVEPKLKVNEAKAQDNQITRDTFRIRLEFDPMSIALFALAIVTRFFRLSEPRNVV